MNKSLSQTYTYINVSHCKQTKNPTKCSVIINMHVSKNFVRDFTNLTLCNSSVPRAMFLHNKNKSNLNK